MLSIHVLCGSNLVVIGVNAAGGPDPQYLTCRGPSMCWTPDNVYAVTRTMHYYHQHDCVVGAVVEQVYNSTFKFSLLKYTRNRFPKMLHFTSKCTKMRLVAGIRPDPLGDLTALRQTT